MTAVLFAQENAGVLLRSFVVALLLVAPVALWQWRRIRASRVAAGNTGAADAGREESGLADTDAPAPGSIEAVVSEVAALARSTEPGETVTVDLAAGATLDGRRADGSVAETIVRDALERSGFDVIDAHRTEAGRAAAAPVSFRARRR